MKLTPYIYPFAKILNPPVRKLLLAIALAGDFRASDLKTAPDFCTCRRYFCCQTENLYLEFPFFKSSVVTLQLSSARKIKCSLGVILKINLQRLGRRPVYSIQSYPIKSRDTFLLMIRVECEVFKTAGVRPTELK